MQRHLSDIKPFTQASRALEWLSKILAVIAAVVLSFMMLLTVADVIGRYFFNRPIKGTWELVGLLLVIAGSWGLAYCQVQKAHISVSIITDRFSRRGRGLMLSLAALIGLFGFSLISRQTFLLAKKYVEMTRGDVTDTLALPFSPFVFALCIGTGMMALMLLVDFFRYIYEVIRK
jgi:TRAP-type C4-dicarboxylate transport system permease small subunit